MKPYVFKDPRTLFENYKDFDFSLNETANQLVSSKQVHGITVISKKISTDWFKLRVKLIMTTFYDLNRAFHLFHPVT